MSDVELLSARALVLADLGARGFADAEGVSLLENALSERRWWVEQWPDGLAFVAGLVATDVQDALLDRGSRWPTCTTCPSVEEHALRVDPEIGGPDPHWVCENSGQAIAPLGRLTAA
ncbi:hypothetical protein INN71_03005 [Nocardioides sp. ChNu-153]|uniref:hypothetical protein n=1 Tax=unclassified Nocardioides TaxID=2615069 RepID=UPI002406E0ED|nr:MULTISPECIES: hypothetical protein [unclassified Nocardioides]MDF9716078.1 hypothetical protein [Nocardioides sp. ChNu-99]MDN7120354.1 hypothetical protein [Nocardioides sp. ChNu-153]